VHGSGSKALQNLKKYPHMHRPDAVLAMTEIVRNAMKGTKNNDTLRKFLKNFNDSVHKITHTDRKQRQNE
jgi:hypothetical protein